MAGIDRRTGKVIDNLTSAYQGAEVAISTRIGSRVMRRGVGGGAVELLGRSMVPSLFSAWQQLVATAIDIWEPRFLTRSITPQGSAEQIRLGQAGLLIEADFRPRGHLGDYTVERVVRFTFTFGRGGILTTSA